MAIYFDIIISVEFFLNKMVELKLNEVADTFIEYWNPDKKFHYKKINLLDFNLSVFNHPDYRGFFIISKNANFNGSSSPYDDGTSPYAIELKGGRETDEEIEKIKCRQIARQPDTSINRVYQKLQRHLKKDSNIDKGVNWRKHFYKNIYYDKRLNKVAWGDFSKKDYQIEIDNNWGDFNE